MIVCRLAGIKDIRLIGSGNIGATNVWRAAGFKVAVWVYITDIGKGVASILIARCYLGNYQVPIDNDLFLVITAIACVLGGIFSVFLKFKGGKGVNAALGAVVTLLPFEVLIGLGVFVITVLVSRYISLGSVLSVITLFVTVTIEIFYYRQDLSIIYFYFSLIIALLIVITHRSNIKRILNGTESKIGSSKKEASDNV